MTTRNASPSVVVSVTAILCVILFGARCSADQKDEKTHGGHELPDGARLRLGTTQYRVGGVWREATLCDDGKTAHVWLQQGYVRMDLASGRVVSELKMVFCKDHPGCGVLSGANAVIADSQGIRILEGSSGKVASVFKGEPFDRVDDFRVDRISVSADGKCAAIGHYNNWGDGDKGLVWVVGLADDSVRGFRLESQRNTWGSLSPKGAILVTGGDYMSPAMDGSSNWISGGLIQAWDLTTSKEIYRVPGISDVVEFSPDGLNFLAIDDKNRFGLYEAKTGKLLWLIAKRIPGSYLQFSTDGKQVIEGIRDTGQIRLWNIKSESKDAEYERPDVPGGWQVRLAGLGHADGVLVGLGWWQGTIVAWDVKNRKWLTRLSGHAGPITAVAFQPDGKELLVAGDGLGITVWDANVGNQIRQVKFKIPPESPRPFGSFGGGRRSFTIDRRLMAVGHWARSDQAIVFDLQQARAIAEVRWPAEPIARGAEVEISPDGKWLACGGVYPSPEDSGKDAHPVSVVSTSSGKLRDEITIQASGQTYCRLTGDGRKMLVVTEEADRGQVKRRSQRVSVWDFESRKALSTGLLAAVLVRQVEVCHDGEVAVMIWSADYRDTTLCMSLWHLATGRAILTKRLEGFEGTTRPAFRCGGRMFAIGGYKNGAPAVFLFETGTLGLRATGRGHNGPIRCVTFNHRGNELASGSDDTTVLLWDVNKLVDHAGTIGLSVGELIKRLAAADSTVAWSAMCQLAKTPELTVQELRKHSSSEKPGPQVSSLLKALLGPNGRERAIASLKLLPWHVGSELDRRGASFPESLRMEAIRLLNNPEGDSLATLREIEILEWMTDMSSRQLLRDWASGECDITVRSSEASKVLGRIDGMR